MPYKNEEAEREWYKERHRRYQNAWRLGKGLEHKKHYQSWLRKHKYGLTREDYDALIKAQDNSCAACRVSFTEAGPTRPVIDHDHRKGNVRGILCCACNRTIGHAQENPSRLRDCANYLDAAK